MGASLTWDGNAAITPNPTDGSGTTGITTDRIGWDRLPDVFNQNINPASLAVNTYQIEYRTGGGYNFLQGVGDAILLHYRVEGSVPEPSSAGLLFGGTLLLRILSRRRGEYRRAG